MRSVERSCPIIDRMGNYGARASDLGGSQTAMNRVGKQIGAKTAALEFLADGKATDEKERYAIWQTPTQLRRGQGGTFLHCGRDGVIADHLKGLQLGANDIGTG